MNSKVVILVVSYPSLSMCIDYFRHNADGNFSGVSVAIGIPMGHESFLAILPRLLLSPYYKIRFDLLFTA